MEHLLHGGVLAGDELHVVHQKDVGGAELLPELLVAALPDGLDELVGEGVALDIDDAVVRVLVVDLVGDGVEQVGLAQARLPVDEEGVVVHGRVVGHRPGGGVGELVGGAHHEPLKGVFLRAGEKALVPGPVPQLPALQVAASQHLHLEVGGEELVKGLLDGGKVAGDDDVPLEVGGGVEDKFVPLHGHGHRVVEPGVDGGGRHVRLHEGKDAGPDIGGGIHLGTSFFMDVSRSKTAKRHP